MTVIGLGFKEALFQFFFIFFLFFSNKQKILVRVKFAAGLTVNTSLKSRKNRFRETYLTKAGRFIEDFRTCKQG